jgi:hypothetical protein
MDYKVKTTLKWNIGNNALSYDDRLSLSGIEPSLTIPWLIVWECIDAKIWESVVFEEVQDGKVISCTGLENFVKIIDWEKEYVIFDNHNHALYFWLDWYKRGLIKKWCELIHIDEHSDLWANENVLDLEKVSENWEYAWEFTNFQCNVGNYIQPAIWCGLVGKMIRIENEFQIDEYMDYMLPENALLNIDLDIFAPDLDHIDEAKKVRCIQNLLKQAKFVTIATSPYFIEQWKALEKLHIILANS